MAKMSIAGDTTLQLDREIGELPAAGMSVFDSELFPEENVKTKVKVADMPEMQKVLEQFDDDDI